MAGHIIGQGVAIIVFAGVVQCPFRSEVPCLLSEG